MTTNARLLWLAGLLVVVSCGLTFGSLDKLKEQKRLVSLRLKSLKGKLVSTVNKPLTVNNLTQTNHITVTNIIAWKYPSGINPSNYWWDIQISTNLGQKTTNWTTIVSHASGETTVYSTNKKAFFRLVGYP